MRTNALTIFTLCALIAAALLVHATDIEDSEFIEYAPEAHPEQGEMYFVMHSNATDAATSILWTNVHTYMWYPQRIRLTWGDKPITNTLTISQIKRRRTDYYRDSTIVTNEFGNVVTNYLHALTNTTYLAWTNALYPATSEIATGGTVSVDLQWDYMQKDDSLLIEWTYTNVSPWTTVIGRR